MRTYIAVPCLDQLDTEFVNALFNLNKPGVADVYFQQSSLVYDSRNRLAEDAIAREADYVLWLDSDMIFNQDMLIDMLNDIKDCDAVCGLFFARRPNFEPCVWTKIRLGESPEENITERMSEIPTEPIEIDGCGMAAVLMRTEVLKAVRDKFGDCFSPMKGFGEDLSFCIRARSLGFKFICDPRIKVGHMARTTVTEETFQVWKQRLGELNGNT